MPRLSTSLRRIEKQAGALENAIGELADTTADPLSHELQRAAFVVSAARSLIERARKEAFPDA